MDIEVSACAGEGKSQTKEVMREQRVRAAMEAAGKTHRQDGDRPDRLIYADGPERFTIRFRGTWA
jgi:hypothetical protein